MNVLSLKGSRCKTHCLFPVFTKILQNRRIILFFFPMFHSTVPTVHWSTCKYKHVRIFLVPYTLNHRLWGDSPVFHTSWGLLPPVLFGKSLKPASGLPVVSPTSEGAVTIPRSETPPWPRPRLPLSWFPCSSSSSALTLACFPPQPELPAHVSKTTGV